MRVAPHIGTAVRLPSSPNVKSGRPMALTQVRHTNDRNRPSRPLLPVPMKVFSLNRQQPLGFHPRDRSICPASVLTAISSLTSLPGHLTLPVSVIDRLALHVGEAAKHGRHRASGAGAGVGPRLASERNCALPSRPAHDFVNRCSGISPRRSNAAPEA
jgi:hypothetical protein